MLLEVKGLTVEQEGNVLLDGVDLAVKEGSIHALVGANGAGKSTLAYAIMGCGGYAPQGEILWEGRSILGLPIHERARLGMTLAWQEPARFEGITVRDYLTLGRDMDPAPYLEKVGLPPLYLERAVDRTLSGGERKRIELASVLALHPRLALLDEPDAGIDLPSFDALVGIIETFREKGSVLLITHREEMARIADDATHLCGGRVVAQGDTETVLAHYRSRRCIQCNGRTCHG